MSDATFKDAETFLADLGVERRPIVVRLPDAEEGDGAAAVAPADPGPLVPADDADHADERAVSTPVDEAAPALPPADTDARPDADVPVRVEVEAEGPAVDPEAVSGALATIRRITAAAPASEGRVRRKLAGRDLDESVIDVALERARRERLVDDDALAAALVAEWRAAGHGPSRLERDLRKRDFDADTIARALAVTEGDDPMAVAFELARGRAEKMRHVPAETAYRRIAAYVARRGHPEAIARKAARDAVYDDRERERTAGH